MNAGRPRPLNAAQRAALEVLVEFADKWRAKGRTEADREAYANLYWHTLQPSHGWARCGWHFSPATLRSLVARGLAEFKPGYEGAYMVRVTGAGRAAWQEVSGGSPRTPGPSTSSTARTGIPRTSITPS